MKEEPTLQRSSPSSICANPRNLRTADYNLNAAAGPVILLPMKPLSECVLYTFVDTGYLRGRAPETVAQALCDGGSDLIQLRAKNSTPEEVRRMARAILPVTRRAGIGLVINDHLAIARELGAEYCHLGQEDFFEAGPSSAESEGIKKEKLKVKNEEHLSPALVPTPASCGEWLRAGESSDGVESDSAYGLSRVAAPGNGRTGIGLSTHGPGQAERALAARPDYIAIGPVYATGTKPGAKPVTLEYVRWAAAHVPIPWFAIGGINLENLGDVLAAGAQRICVVSAILNAPDIAQACRTFRGNILRLRKSRP